MSNTGETSPGPRGRTREGHSGVQSVDRAITVLEILAREGQAGVTEVAAEIGVHKSTAFRLLAALEERDLVEQNSERGSYRLAFGILRLASAIPTRIDLTRQAQPVVDELAAKLDETVNLAVVQEHYAVNVQQARGSAAVTSWNWVGQLTPLHATSSGKVLLAHMPADRRLEILRTAGQPRLTEHTITDRDELLAQLDEVREGALGTAFEEMEIGLNAASVPVRDHTGSVVGALSVAGPAFRFGRAEIEAAEADLRDAGDTIGHRMGWMG